MSWSGWAQAATNPTKRLLSNQIDFFSRSAINSQLYLAIISSGCSIVACLAAIYMFFAIDPKRLVFRHQLIAFLMLYDLLKAVILLIFPARVVGSPSAYDNYNFCQVVGFFTATSIEGADLAILAFAIHTFLLIFKPDLQVKFPGSSRVEGGLYRYRYYVYGLALVIPLALASFPYIGTGYSSFVCWCYLPQEPIWMRLVLSWVPRYCIVIVIMGVYGSIYFHVLKEFRSLGGVFVTMHRQKKSGLRPTASSQKLSLYNSIVFFFRDVRDFFFFTVPGSENQSSSSSSSSSSDPNHDLSKMGSPARTPIDEENVLDNAHFQAANLESFRYRQKTIEKQMKSIFVYPVAYISIWLFPFILHCTQFNYEETHGPIVWLNFISAFAQPFIGFVDAVVFFYREQPWKYTIMRTYERENISKIEQNLLMNLTYGDNESINTSARVTRSSIGGLHVDLSSYSKWRRILSKLNFPFMHLPDDKNIAKFQDGIIHRKLKDLRNSDQTVTNSAESPSSDPEINDLQAKHDFSNLLDGSLNGNDFRHALDNYSLSLQNERKTSVVSSADGKRRSSLASISNKSTKSRRPSVYDCHDLIPEDGAYMPSNKNLQPGMFARRQSIPNSQCTSNRVEEEGELDFLEILNRGPA